MESIDELASDLDDSRVLLTIEEDDWNGVCHPDIDGPTKASSKHGAPFEWRTAGNPPSPEEVGERFEQDFEGKVNSVYDLIDNSDKPSLDSIMDLDPDELIVSPEYEEGDK